MSSGKKKSKKKQNKKSGSNTAGARNAHKAGYSISSVREYTAAAPAVLMCAMTAFMLIADLFAKDPKAQYDMYPALFRVIDPVIIIACIVCAVTVLCDKKLRIALIERLKQEKEWICFAIFVLLMLISTCVNGLDDNALHGIPYRNIGVFGTCVFVILYTGASAQMRGRKVKRAALLIYSAVADLIALSALYNAFIGEIGAYQEKKELSAIFFNGNHYGYFLAMAVLIGTGFILHAEGRDMIAGAVTAVLNMIVLCLNHSLGCIAAVLIVSVISAAVTAVNEPRRRRRTGIMIGAAAALLAAGLLLMPELRSEFTGFAEDAGRILSGKAGGSEGHNRLKIWARTVKYISEQPLLGYGCEGMSMRLYKATGISNPHNEILTYAAYYGIPAATAYAAGVIFVFARSIFERGSKGGGPDMYSKISCMAAAGYFISSLTGVGMFYTLPFFFIFLGMACDREK